MEQAFSYIKDITKKQGSDSGITLELEKFSLHRQTPLPLKLWGKHSNSLLHKN